MEGFKAVDKNFCSQFGDSYFVGHHYVTEEELNPGISGFHYCENLQDCLFHFNLKESRFLLIEIEGNVRKYGEKCVTDKFYVKKELTKKEIIQLCPTFFPFWVRFLAKIH